LPSYDQFEISIADEIGVDPEIIIHWPNTTALGLILIGLEKLNDVVVVAVISNVYADC
jgi:hypothetical protein